MFLGAGRDTSEIGKCLLCTRETKRLQRARFSPRNRRWEVASPIDKTAIEFFLCPVCEVTSTLQQDLYIRLHGREEEHLVGEETLVLPGIFVKDLDEATINEPLDKPCRVIDNDLIYKTVNLDADLHLEDPPKLKLKISLWQKILRPFKRLIHKLKRKYKEQPREKTHYRNQTEIYDMMHDKIMNEIDLTEEDIELAKRHDVDLEELLKK